jgi:HSP20 family molecular chaperone IbpA
MFRPMSRRPQAAWEPPVDVLETEHEVLVLAALPGVDVAKVEAAIEGAGTLVISGQRVLPIELATARIHRLELPQGRFERRVPLPPGRYSNVRRSEAHGCLVISLSKA